MDAKKEFYKDVDKPMPLLVNPSFLSSLVEQLSYDAQMVYPPIENEDKTYIMAASGVQYLSADFIIRNGSCASIWSRKIRSK